MERIAEVCAVSFDICGTAARLERTAHGTCRRVAPGIETDDLAENSTSLSAVAVPGARRGLAAPVGCAVLVPRHRTHPRQRRRTRLADLGAAQSARLDSRPGTGAAICVRHLHPAACVPVTAAWQGKMIPHLRLSTRWCAGSVLNAERAGRERAAWVRDELALLSASAPPRSSSSRDTEKSNR